MTLNVAKYSDPLSNLKTLSTNQFPVSVFSGEVQSSLPFEGVAPGAKLGNTYEPNGRPGTLDALRAALTAERFPLLHLVCHGQFNRETRDTALWLADANNQAKLTPASDFIACLQSLEDGHVPYCIFLSACESAYPGAQYSGGGQPDEALGSLAQTLVQQVGVPAVVAMTEKVSVSTAQMLAEGFYSELVRCGYVDQALVKATAPLATAGDVLVAALFTCLEGKPLFSNELDRELTDTEITRGLSRMEALLDEHAPVLKEALTSPARVLRKLASLNPDIKDDERRAERAAALRDANSLCQEAIEVTFHALAFDKSTPKYDARCPFRGLLAFRSQDEEFFFGRAELARKAAERLAAPSSPGFLALIGQSGSGKSSLAFAGVVPTLRKTEPSLPVAVFRPGSDPLIALENARFMTGAVGEQSTEHPDSCFTVTNPPSGMAHPLLIVDQFEELFTLCAEMTRRQNFVSKLLALRKQIRILICLREDFRRICAQTLPASLELAYPELEALLRQDRCVLSVSPLGRGDLLSTVKEQAAETDLRFEADLANTILDDLAESRATGEALQPGSMPLLQHALLELWNRRHGRWLRAEEYRAIGGVEGAIAATAQKVYSQISPEERERVRDIFVRLVRIDEEAISGGERLDTRRRLLHERLVPAGEDDAATIRVVEHLASASLVVTSKEESGERELVELAHEALIHQWRELNGWLTANLTDLLLRQELGFAAREWHLKGRTESFVVHEGAKLEEAEALSIRALQQAPFLPERADDHPALEANKIGVKLNQLETDYLIAAAEKRNRLAKQRARYTRLRQWGLALVATLALAASIAAIIAYQQQGEAERQARLHLTAEQDAKAQATAARAAEKRISEVASQANVSLARYSQAAGNEAQALAHLAQALKFNQRNYEAAALTGAMLTQISWPLPLVGPLQHEKAVRSAQFSPDGQRVVTASFDKTARLWDALSGKAIGEPMQHQDEVYSARFSPDGKRVVTASGDGTARLWDALSGKAIGEPMKHEKLVWSAQFSPDGRRVVTASFDHTARLWDAATGKPIGQPMKHEDVVYSAQFSPDGQRVVTASRGSDRAALGCGYRETNRPADEA